MACGAVTAAAGVFGPNGIVDTLEMGLRPVGHTQSPVFGQIVVADYPCGLPSVMPCDRPRK